MGIQSESLSGKCMMHMHEIVDKHGRIPILECGSACHPAGMREKRVSFTCMSKSNRRTHHIAEKIRSGEVLHELKNLPESSPLRGPCLLSASPTPSMAAAASVATPFTKEEDDKPNEPYHHKTSNQNYQNY